MRKVANSEVRLFKTCRRAWYLAYVLGLRSRRRRVSGPASLGNRVHEPLAAYYETWAAVGDSEAAAAALQATLLEGIERDRPKVEPGGEKEFEKDVRLASAMLEGYLQWLEETGEDEDLEVIGVEEACQVEAPRESWVLICKKDLRFRRRSTGAVGFLDHKTVQEFTTPLKTLHLDEQMLWYMLVERLLKIDEPAEAALYNMLRKVGRTATAKPPFYQRYDVHHNDEELRAFWHRLFGVLGDMAQVEAQLRAGADHRVVAYPTPTRDCSWRCEFYALCPLLDAEPGNAKWMMAEAYEVGDPYARYGDAPDPKGEGV